MGGAARIWAMINFLRRQGHSVNIVTVAHSRSHVAEIQAQVNSIWMKKWVSPSKGSHILQTLKKHWDPIRKFFWISEKEFAAPFVRNALARRRDLQIEALAADVCRETKPDAVICTFAWTAPLLNTIDSDIVKVVDTIDVQHLRDKAAVEAGYPSLGIDCTAEDESSYLSSADIILAIQREERDCLKNLLPNKSIVLAEHALPVRPLPSPHDSKRILFVGNLYNPNTEGILAFIYAVWPKIRAVHRDAELIIGGHVCREVKSCPEKGIKSLGLIPDLSLEILNSAIIINPTPYGTGLKIKATEAMANGKCLVSTQQGVLGLHPDILKAAEVVPLEDMASAIIRLLQYPAARRRMERKALHFAKRHLSPDVVYAELEKCLVEASQRRSK
jgi:glycosyltransferase involved in cell wall biosynthesis